MRQAPFPLQGSEGAEEEPQDVLALLFFVLRLSFFPPAVMAHKAKPPQQFQKYFLALWRLSLHNEDRVRIKEGELLLSSPFSCQKEASSLDLNPNKMTFFLLFCFLTSSDDQRI